MCYDWIGSREEYKKLVVEPTAHLTAYKNRIKAVLATRENLNPKRADRFSGPKSAAARVPTVREQECANKKKRAEIPWEAWNKPKRKPQPYLRAEGV
jgi:hypothetical protein